MIYDNKRVPAERDICLNQHWTGWKLPIPNVIKPKNGRFRIKIVSIFISKNTFESYSTASLAFT